MAATANLPNCSGLVVISDQFQKHQVKQTSAPDSNAQEQLAPLYKYCFVACGQTASHGDAHRSFCSSMR
jgi:hypothetical protein